MAAKLHERYDEPWKAITTIGQCMTKALFAGKVDTVIFWALVHAYYRAALFSDTKLTMARFSEIVLPDPNGID
ncbi:hypothetical protein QO058_30610 (plasmid) [Bosea vestrisii]|uniref:hypothetical protein n=1 Tax=Bosea vestrisii TaxID=151416 RepID=UPI0024E019AD|nr:hypothetical protein [Bosea vestrisii]WID99747.1 hypothetical protein QO058_30610 [Bosea vestrisii]